MSVPEAPPINRPLLEQLETLRSRAATCLGPGSLLTWLGAAPLPSPDPGGPPLDPAGWKTLIASLWLGSADLVSGVADCLPKPLLLPPGIRADGPLPVAICRFDLACPTESFRRQVEAAARRGGTLPLPLPHVQDLISSRSLLAVAALMTDQWNRVTPRCRSRRLSWQFDARYYFGAPGSPLPDHIAFDPGDGGGFRDVAFGDTILSNHPSGDQVTFTVRCAWGDRVEEARGTVLLEEAPLPPPPDATWALTGRDGRQGKAYVYLANGGSEVSQPVLMAEGFPGGYSSDWLYETFNQHGLTERLRERGHDVIFLSFADGTVPMEGNTSVVVALLEMIHGRTSAPIAAGGISMGGLIIRYALAWMETHGLSHNCHLYFSVDTPHLGATTSLAIQWFSHFFRGLIPGLDLLSALIETPSNRQFLKETLHGAGPQGDPLRQAFQESLARVGNFPCRLRRIAVACGTGTGGRWLEPGQPLLTWSGSALASASLRAAGDGLVASGHAFTREGTCLRPEAGSWEGVHGGLHDYPAIAAALASRLGLGEVRLHQALVCGVPTVSALAIDQDPALPIPSPAAAVSPFHDYICSEADMPHLKLTPAVAQWLLEKLTAIPLSAAGPAEAARLVS